MISGPRWSSFRSTWSGSPRRAFLDLLVHRRDTTSREAILEVGRVALHEALAVRVEEDAALAAHALGDEHARARHARRMELPELHVLERDAARAAMPRPSPVLMNALVDAAKMRPAPPVARTVTLACRIMTSPVSISYATTT